MVKAFVLVETASGKSRETVAGLKKLPEVKSVDIVTPPYDVIAVAEGNTRNDIGNLLVDKIRRMDGIIRVVTCLAN